MYKYLNQFKKQFVRILHWSQRYTKTDMLYLTKGGFWLGLGHVVQAASGLVLATAFANLLSKDAFGLYQFVLSMASILSVFTLSGLGTAMTRAVARGDDGILKSGFRTKMLWNTGITIASGAVALYYFVQDNDQLAVAFLIVGAFAPFLEGFNLYQPFLIGKQHFKESVLLGAWRKPIPIVSIITALFFTNDPIVLVFIYFATQALSAGLVYMAVLKRYPSSSHSDKETIGYSKHLSILKLVGRFSDHADKILLFHFLGAAVVASYVLAQLPVKYTRTMFSTLFTLVLPKFSKRDYSTLQKTLPRKVWLFTIVMLIIAAAYIIAAPFLFMLIFPAYPESVLVSQALALALVFLPNATYQNALTAHKKTRELYILRFGALTTRIILFAILIPLYGIWGVVYTILVLECLAAIGVRILFARKQKK